MDISDAIKKSFDLIAKVLKAVSPDGPGGKKVTLSESIGLAISGIGLIPAIKAYSELVEDWKSRDDAKKKQWLELFKENFDLPNDELEAQIEKIVEALLMLEGAISVLSVPPAPGQDPPGDPDDDDED